MQQDITQNQADIIDTDRAASLEIAFLLQKVHTVAEQWVQDAFFESLSKPPVLKDNQFDTTTVLLELKRLRCSRRFACIPASTSKDVETTILFIAALGTEHAGSQLRSGTVGTSPLIARALDVMANWLVVRPTLTSKTLKGSAAAEHLFKELSKNHKEGGQEGSNKENVFNKLVMLRNFLWLLDAKQREQFDSWMQAHVRNAKASAQQHLHAMLVDKGSSAPSSSSGTSSSSSSSSLVPNSLCSLMKNTPQKTRGKRKSLAETSTLEQSPKEKMMALFSGSKLSSETNNFGS